MNMHSPVCTYCGGKRTSHENITTYCSTCSGLRSLIAQKAFSDRKTIYLEGAGYIISRRIKNDPEITKI